VRERPKRALLPTMRLAVWQVREDGPVRIPAGQVALEQELEDWIAADPSLAVEGLEVVGRQVHLEGGRLDLLGVDPQGQWTVVEIKRGRLYRDTVAQALDYASSVSTMPTDRLREIVQATGDETALSRSPIAEALEESEGDTRDVRLVVVGTGRDSSLDRIVRYLGDLYEVPIQVVTFEVFAVGAGGKMLVREVTEAEGSTAEPTPSKSYSLEAVFAVAERQGNRDPFDAIYQFAVANSLYARPWRWSIMYTPPSARKPRPVHGVDEAERGASHLGCPTRCLQRVLRDLRAGGPVGLRLREVARRPRTPRGRCVHQPPRAARRSALP
jgi:hypothetical protein